VDVEGLHKDMVKEGSSRVVEGREGAGAVGWGLEYQ
jgi:hypothetical protein